MEFKKYKNDYETKFICPIEPTKELVEEYERRKNVFDNNGKKVRKHWKIGKK